jgi:diguanylate cyclase (GGDEF)-like protein
MFAKDGFVARIGGDEFVVLVRWSETQLKKVSQQFQVSLVKRPIAAIPNDANAKITLATSVGVTTLKEADDCAAALARADEALYEMKKRFGGRAA